MRQRREESPSRRFGLVKKALASYKGGAAEHADGGAEASGLD